ncbi:MAG: dipeptide epimerase [Marinilabiliales bacterium]|nr:MAG: dipeptide epimerase [Marinilabiliales bacterium]
MRITRVEVYKASIRLKKPFIISLGAITHADNIYLRIITDRGVTGYGECSPSLTINGESQGTCTDVGHYLARTLIGKDPRDIEGCTAIMDAVIYGNTSIKSAFDIALHDIAARVKGLPLFEFLGGNERKELYTDYTVSLDDASVMAADALEIMNRGFRFIKVKLGDNRENDLRRVASIRSAVGPEIPLRLDANQGWDRETAVLLLNDLAGMNIEYCEEPIPRWDFMSLPEVRRSSPVPLMADESCLDQNDASRLIGLGACDYINIKLGKSSGLHKAVKIAGVASRAGVLMMVGGFMESRLAFTASAHLSLTNDHIVFSDFDSPMMMEEDPVTGGIVYGENGLVDVPDGPGLGASVDEGYLQRLPCAVIE